jgi:hypothetical protein
MNLKNVIDQLSHGELRNVFMADTTDGDLNERQKEMLITHVTMGLAALHTRFFLKERTHVVNLLPDKRRYSIDEPDLLRIEAVRDLVNDEYLINVLGEPESLHTPDYRTLDVPLALYEEIASPVLEVFYRANHLPLDKLAKYLPLDRTEIDLPYTHLEALTLYVASRVMNPVGMSETFHDGNNYAAKYEQACQRLELSGFEVNQTGGKNKFSAGGWV